MNVSEGYLFKCVEPNMEIDLCTNHYTPIVVGLLCVALNV